MSMDDEMADIGDKFDADSSSWCGVIENYTSAINAAQNKWEY